MLPANLEKYRPLVRKVWFLAVPVMLTYFMQSLVNVVDVFMAGRLGPIEVAAVGMSTTVRMLVLIFILSVKAGSMALAAQAKGARDPERLSFVARQTFSLVVIISLILSVIGWFISEPIMMFLNSGGEAEATRLGTEYLQLLFLGTVFLAGNFAVSSLMQGAGDTVTPLYLTGGINLLNILFNYLFMFGPGPFPAMGVVGAAVGILLARSIGMVIGLYIIYRGNNVVKLLPNTGSYWPNWRMFGDMLGIGVPSGLQGVMRNGSQVFVTRIVTSTAAGTFGAAALAIGFKVESLAFMSGLGFNVAATSLVGQSLGAWQIDDARERGYAALFLGMIVMSTLALPMVIFAPWIVRLFEPSAHPTVVSAGASYLRIHGSAQPLLAFAMVLNGALRGAGDTRPGLYGTILGRWLIAIPLSYLLAIPLGFGVEGVWFALVVGIAIQAVYLVVRWRSRKWLDIALHKTPLYRQHLQHLPVGVQQAYLAQVRTPLMAQPGVTEHIHEDEVVYQHEDQVLEVHIAFTDEDYFVTEGREQIPTSSASRRSLGTPAPAYD